MKRFTTGTIPAVCVAFGVASAAGVSADPIAYYAPPTMVKQGTSTTPTAGPGQVIVKVLVNADGSSKVINVLKSTNHADDATALEIAKTSTYAPATRGSKKIVAFYDFTLKFTGTGVSADTGSSGSLAQYERDLNDGNYAGAQAGLKTYVQNHPSDPKGELDLGVADTYLDDYGDGVAAFDKAGSVPSSYQAIAEKAYDANAVTLLNAKDYAGGLAAAKRAVAFAPGFVSDDTLGVAELENDDSANALTELRKAHDLAANDSKITTSNRANNDLHIVQAELAAGDLDGAQKAATEAKGFDPKSAAQASALVGTYYAGKAQDASKAGKSGDAAALYEQAAVADPPDALTMYVNASFAELNAKPTADAAKAKDAADKALALDPQSPEANFAEGAALADLSRKSDAQTYLSKAETLAKADNKTTLVSSIQNLEKQLAGSQQ